jgi:predicted GTPase
MTFLDKIMKLPGSDKEKKEKQDKLLRDLQIPVKIIGIGQTGVGKTELLRSIFAIKGETSQENVLDHLKTGSTKAVTKEFYSFTVKNSDGFSIQFTDGPG